MARPKQETLTLFPEIVSITRKFSDAQFGALMRAVFAYRFGGETYSGDDPAVDVAFQTVAGQIDRYIEICKGNSQNAKGREREQNEAECSETKQNPPPIHSMSYPNPIPKDVADKPPTRKRFVPPTVPMVAAYCEEKGYHVDAERFVSYYEAIGWKVGRNPMKSWQAAVRTWASKGSLQRIYADGSYHIRNCTDGDRIANPQL